MAASWLPAWAGGGGGSGGGGGNGGGDEEDNEGLMSAFHLENVSAFFGRAPPPPADENVAQVQGAPMTKAVARGRATRRGLRGEGCGERAEQAEERRGEKAARNGQLALAAEGRGGRGPTRAKSD